MKELDFYEEYTIYLDWRLNENQITKGKYSLFKISKTEYDRFIKRLETDEAFNNKFIKILQSEKRDEKIDHLISDDLSDDFFKDLENIEYDKKTNDFFNEFDL
jgi:hypothetical protein